MPRFQRTQVGHGIAAGIALQGSAVAAEQIYLVADAALHGLDLAALEGDKSPLSGQLIQNADLLPDELCQFLVVFTDRLFVLVDTGQKKRFNLNLGGG